MKNEPWGPKLRMSSADDPKTLTDVALLKLRRDVVSGRLRAGEKLRAQELSAVYKVGKGPLREALFQLVSDGLVQSEGQRGFRVATLNVEELLDITNWRVQMETQALRLAIERGDVQWEANALAAYHRLKRLDGLDISEAEAADQWEDRHNEFHFTLYAACGSPWLLRFCEMLNEHAQRYRRAFVSYSAIDPAISQEHQRIVDATIARDADAAVGALTAHIRRAAELATAFLKHDRP